LTEDTWLDSKQYVQDNFKAYSFECGWRPAQPKGFKMKDEIHPNYRDVVFVDLQTGNKFITRSTLNSRETIEMDGKTYPLFKCDVTSESHPFYTGAQTRIVETGRVEKFRARFARTSGTKKASA
jgi:large subunit ribosomal protein L31